MANIFRHFASKEDLDGLLDEGFRPDERRYWLHRVSIPDSKSMGAKIIRLPATGEMEARRFVEEVIGSSVLVVETGKLIDREWSVRTQPTTNTRERDWAVRRAVEMFSQNVASKYASGAVPQITLIKPRKVRRVAAYAHSMVLRLRQVNGSQSPTVTEFDQLLEVNADRMVGNQAMG